MRIWWEDRKDPQLSAELEDMIQELLDARHNDTVEGAVEAARILIGNTCETCFLLGRGRDSVSLVRGGPAVYRK